MTNIAQGTSVPSVFSFESTNVRTFADENGGPWFLANDVCAVLGYKNPRMSVDRHCRAGGVTKRDTPTESGIQEMTFINEGNLYRLIIKSRKPEAERFEQWVMEEVLPAIRKTGQYVAQPYTTGPRDTLTAEQADTLRRVLTDAVKRLPKDKQAAAMIKGWSKLKAHFKTDYRHIPQAEFAEALSIVARHIAEQGELLDAEPRDMVSKAHALRCLQLAGAAFAEAQRAVAANLLDMDELTVQHGRILVAMDWSGQIATATPVPSDAAVMSPARLLRALSEEGNGIPLSTADLARFVEAATKKLAHRCAYYESKTERGAE